LVITATPGRRRQHGGVSRPRTTAAAGFTSPRANWNLSGGSSDKRVLARSPRLQALGWSSVDKSGGPSRPRSRTARRTSPLSGRWWSPLDGDQQSGGKRASRWLGPGRCASRKTAPGSARPDIGRPPLATTPVNGAFAFWSQGRASRAASSGSSVTIETIASTRTTSTSARAWIPHAASERYVDGGAPVTLRLLLPHRHHLADAASLVSGRRGRAAHGGDHALGNKNPSSQAGTFYFDFLEWRSRERRSRSGFDDYRRGGRDRLRYGQHLQAYRPQRLVWKHQEGSAAGRDRPLLRRVLVEAVGGFQSSYPQCTITFSGTGTIRMSSGCTSAARRSAKQSSAGRTQQHHARHFANSSTRSSMASGPSATGKGPHDHVSIPSQRVAVPRVQPALPTSTPAAPGHGDGEIFRRNLRCYVGDRPTQTPVLNRRSATGGTDFFIQLKANNMSAVSPSRRSWCNRRTIPLVVRVGSTLPTARRWRRPTGFGNIEQFADRLQFRATELPGQAFAADGGLDVAGADAQTPVWRNPLVVPGRTRPGWLWHDADTQAAAQSALGRRWRRFTHPMTIRRSTAYADANSSGRRLFN